MIPPGPLRGTILAAAVVAVLVQLDWLAGTGFQAALLDGFATTKFATASLLLMLCAGAGLALGERQRASRGLGVLVVILTAVASAGLLPDAGPLLLEPSTASSVMCALIGMNLALGRRWRPLRSVAATCAFLGALIGFGGVLGHLIGQDYLYRVAAFSSMSPITSTLGTIIGLAALAADARLPVGPLLRDRGAAGTVLRGLLPAIPLIPVLLSLILRFTSDPELSTPYLDVGLVMVLLTGVMVAGTFVLSMHLNRVDTARASADAARRSSEAFTERILSAVPNAVLVVDDQGLIERANEVAESLFGAPPGGLGGMPLERLVPAATRAKHASLRAGYMTRAAARTMGEGRDLAALRLDGSEFPVAVGLRPVEMAGRTWVVASVADLTDRLEAERALRRHAEDLARSNAALEQFAFISSHDLREPLRAIEGFGGRLLEEYGDALDERGQGWLQHMVDGAQRMSLLVRDLLNYSRSRSRELVVEEFELSAALLRVLEELATVIEDSGARVTHDPLPVVRADVVQVRLLLRNLVSNAIRYRDETRPPRIHLGCRPAGAGWEFTVSDNGIGIAPQYLERIFLVFKRLNPQSHSPGSGMGLALCHSILERHGGRIWVTSEPGEGSCFHFTLPDRPGTLADRPETSA